VVVDEVEEELAEAAPVSVPRRVAVKEVANRVGSLTEVR